MTEIVSPSIIDFSAAQAERSTSTPPADRVLSGQPQQTVRNFFSDATGQFFAGTWESTPGRWRVRYSENEFCHITRGRVRLEDCSGHHWSFGAGASFVVPAGFEGVWEVIEPTHKFYAIFESASR